jgi:surface antigen
VQIFNRRFKQVGVLVFLTIALALSAQATTYNKASLKGSYSFLTDLWTANTGTDQIAMVGVLTFNGAGKVTGSYTSVSLEALQTGTLGGTYTVSANGTGKLIFKTGSTAQFAISLNSTSAGVAQGVQLLQINDNKNETVSGTAVLQSTTAQTYTVASLKGNFGFQWNIWSADPSGFQGSIIGMCSFDGKGAFKSSGTTVVGGVVKAQTETGTYTVNPDGSGSISFPGSEVAFALNSVAAGQAKGGQFIQNLNESGNYVITGIALMQ